MSPTNWRCEDPLEPAPIPPDETSLARYAFLYTAVDPGGDPKTGRVEARDLKAARQQLETEGCTSIVFHTDEAWEALGQLRHPKTYPKSRWTPEQEFAFLRNDRMPMYRLIPLLLKSPREILIGILILGPTCYLVARLFYAADPLPALLWWSGILIISLVFTALYIVGCGWLPQIVFHHFIKAYAWADWPAFHKWVQRLRWLKRLWLYDIPDFNIDTFVAKAWAAEGKFPDALALMQSYQGQVHEPLLYGVLGSIHGLADDFATEVEYDRRAIASSPDAAHRHIDHALTLIQRLRDPERARQALEPLNDLDVLERYKPHVTFCHGLIALEEHRYEDASLQLAQALRPPSAIKKEPLFMTFNLLIKAYLAIAMSQLGKQEQAAALFDEAEPLLTAWRETELIDRCKDALSN